MNLGHVLCAALLTPVVAGCTSTAVLPPTLPTKTCFQEMHCGPSREERFYLLVFTSQFTPNLPRHTHTWATVVRVMERDSNRPPQIETHTISWFPASLRIRPWDLFVESVMNL